MRYLIGILILALCLFFLAAPDTALALSADGVLKQAARNRPQINALKTVYDYYLLGDNSGAAPGDTIIRQTVFFRAPDRIRLNLSWPDREEVYLAAGMKTLVMVGDQAARAQWPQPFLLYRLLIASDPEEMRNLLAAFDVDLETVTATTYQKQRVVILGAKPDEPARSQAWFDRNKYRLVRLILAAPGQTRVIDVELDDYQTHGRDLQWPGAIRVKANNQSVGELILQKLSLNPSIDQEDLDLETLSKTVAAPPQPETETSGDPELEQIRKQMKWLENKLK
jgi:hypothetical protein